ncbi:MAG TPA: PAS domain S-box protein [Thermoanaerobaculia bacterium]|nr:PAS domain S-box protein [Thermoanaerobaculia bacterium]
MTTQLLSVLAYAIGDPLQVTTADDAFLGVNRAWTEQIGYDADVVAGLAFSDIVHPEDREHYAEIVRQVVAGRTVTFEVRIRTSDSLVVPFEGTSSLATVDGVPAILTVFRDITEQKRVLALLTQSEQRFRAISLYAPVGIFETDARGECTYVNDCWCEMTGLTPVEALGSGWREAIHPEDRDLVYREWDAAVASRGEFRLEYRYRNVRSGETVWLEGRAVPLEGAAGSMEGYLGIALDMTARKKAEAALTDSEARYRDLVESSPGVICTHDLQGKLLSVNPAAAAALGSEPGAFVGKNLVDVTAPWARDELPKYLERIVRERSDHGLLAVVTASGDERIWSYNSVLRRDPNGVEYVLAHALDVTELKRTEEQVRALSLTDELTGLSNRRGFLILADQQLRVVRSARIPQTLMLVFGDLDGLKTINDTLGHEAGDAAIRECARLLREACRDSDIIARLGGDEFVILAISATPDPEVFFARIRKHFDDWNAQPGSPFRLSISLGARVIAPGETASVAEMIADADREMYVTKRRAKSARAS